MNKKSRTKNTAKNLTVSLAAEFLLVFVKFACRTMFVYVMGKEYLGINGLFSDILKMLSITELGIDTAMNYKLYKPLAQNDIPRLQVLMKFYKTAYVVVGSCIAVLGLILIPFLPNLIKDYGKLEPLGINPELLFVLYLMQSAVSYLFFASESAIIKADQKEYITYATNFVCRLTMNVFQIASLFLWKNFLLYVILEIVFNVIQNCTNAMIARKQYPKVFRKTNDRISMAEIKDMFKDLGALFLGKIQQVILGATDNLVLSAFIGLTIVGMYSNYLLIYVTIKTILHRVFSSVKSSMGNLFTTDDLGKKYHFFSVMNFMTALLYGTAAVGVSVVVDELIKVWIGEEFVIGFPFAILLGLEILTLGLKQNLYQAGDVAGVFRQFWYRPLISVIINVVVSVSLVQVCGIYGVLIGTLVADVVGDLCIVPYVIFKYALRECKPVSVYYKKNLCYLLVIGVVGAGDWILCRMILINIGWLSVMVHSAICGLSVPLVLMIIFGRSDEGKYLIGLLIRCLKVLIKKKTHL